MGICSSSLQTHLQIEKEAGTVLLTSLEQAIALYTKALELKLKSKEKYHLSIGRSYLMLGLILGNKKQDFEMGIENLLKALPLLEKDDLRNYVLCYFFIGTYYTEMNKFPQAHETMRKSLEISKNTYGMNDFETIMCMNGMAYVYRKEEKYDQAINYYIEAETLLENLPGNKADIELTNLVREALLHGNDIDQLELSIKAITAVLHPNMCRICFFIGELSLKLDKKQDAYLYFNKQLEYVKKIYEKRQNYDFIMQNQISQIRKLYSEHPGIIETSERLISLWKGKTSENPVENLQIVVS